MKRFFVGLLSYIDPLAPKLPYKGRGFNIDFELTDFHHSININGQSIPAKYMAIKCSNLNKARMIFDVIDSSQGIIDCCLYHDNSSIKEEIHEINQDFNVSDKFHTSLTGHGYQLAAYMASEALKRDEKYLFALAKLNLSLEIISVAMIDLAPYHSQPLEKPTLRKPLPPNDIVRLSEAINLAYSSIEELGLKPARAKIGEKGIREKGVWNERIREKLKAKLASERIKAETVVWHIRGPKTYLEKSLYKSESLNTLEWKRYDVRDQEIDITDALAEAHFLRNQVTTHAYTYDNKRLKSVKTLSIYDVVNIQHLARTLLLDSLGILDIIRSMALERDKTKE